MHTVSKLPWIAATTRDEREFNAFFLLLLATAVSCGASPRVAHGFASIIYDGPPHQKITAEACQAEDFDAAVIRDLEIVVVAPDFSETNWNQRPNRRYVAAHHFDRNPGVTDANAFSTGAAYLREQRQAVLDRVGQGQIEGAIESLGRVFHVLQDFFSHSNYIDMAAADQQKCIDAFYDAAKNPPAGLKLTGYDPNPDKTQNPNPEAPQNDAWSHRTFAKDWSTKNAESKTNIGAKTKYELAREAAVAETRHLLQTIAASLDQDGWDLLRGIPILLGLYEDDPWACGFACGPAGDDLGCLAQGTGYALRLVLPPGALAWPDSIHLVGKSGSAFKTHDMIVAEDGANLAPWWVIQSAVLPPGVSFGSPGVATAAIPDTVFADQPDSAQMSVYRFDPDSLRWRRVAGSIVSPIGGYANFAVEGPGAFALGSFQLDAPVELPIFGPLDLFLFGAGLAVAGWHRLARRAPQARSRASAPLPK